MRQTLNDIRYQGPHYYRVRAQQGHAGARNYTEIVFYIKAQNIVNAMWKAKRMPSVKHSQPIVSATEISLEEYQEGRKISAYLRNQKIGELK